MSYVKSEKALRRMRQRVCTWGDREAQADRVLHYLKVRMMRQPKFFSHGSTMGEAYARVMWM